MSMEITVKDKVGKTIARRGKRRVTEDGELKNQAISTKTMEWTDLSVLKAEAEEVSKLEATGSIEEAS